MAADDVYVCALLICHSAQSGIQPASYRKGDYDAKVAKPNQQKALLVIEHCGHLYTEANAPTAECHAPTVVETSNGLLAAWFGGTHEKHPDVGIWTSHHGHDGWSRAIEVVKPMDNTPCWNPVLNRDGDSVVLYFKTGPSPSTWRGFKIVSRDDGVTWTTPQPLEAPFLGPVKNKSVRLPDGRWLHPSSTEHDGWRSHFEIDETSIVHVLDPLQLGAIQPTVLHTHDKFVALFRTRAGSIGRSESSDGHTWAPLQETTLPNPNSGIDAVTLRDGRHVLVHNPTSIAEGKWGGRRTPLVASLSDDTQNWSDTVTLEDADGEFSYPAVIQTGDGRVHTVYTHRRKTIAHVVLLV